MPCDHACWTGTYSDRACCTGTSQVIAVDSIIPIYPNIIFVENYVYDDVYVRILMMS